MGTWGLGAVFLNVFVCLSLYSPVNILVICALEYRSETEHQDVINIRACCHPAEENLPKCR